MTQLLYYIKPSGDLYFITDVADYAQQVAEFFPTIDGYSNQLAAPYTLELAEYPQSKYMRRFLDQGLPIHFQHQQRQADFVLATEKVPAIEMGFRNRHTLEG